MFNLNNIYTNPGIYKITSPTGNVYVGQATNLKRRLRMYIGFYKASLKQQRKLYNSFVKYGADKHHYEILEYCNLNQLNDREAYYKQELVELVGWKSCLFCKVNDIGAGPKAPDTVTKMSQSHKGKKHTDETKLKMSNSAKKRGFTEEHRANIAKALKGKKAVNKRSINQYSLLGELVGTYESIVDAKQKTGINPNQCVSGHTKSAGGFFWKYSCEKL